MSCAINYTVLSRSKYPIITAVCGCDVMSPHVWVSALTRLVRLAPRASSCVGVLVFLLPQALFNRLLLPEPGNHLIYMTACGVANLSADRDAGEKCAIPYLYACYQRAKEEVGAPLWP